ncbi:olfactomedin-4-like [Rana temporaria]|uniref:olfactomedin-4-like n=1 Tax=Rana temporaria TaxID=8407 RepID=UPI001AAD9DD7|nr:olfactomedin-4-like [Rana temporaria]
MVGMDIIGPLAIPSSSGTLESTLDDTITRTNQNTDCIENIHKRLDDAMNKIDDLENHSRCYNFRINGSTGTLDANGVCHCSVMHPDSTFPVDRMESLEIANRNLTIIVNEEITKIHNYERTVNAHINQLKDLTRRLETMENSGLSYSELDFELIKLEIKEMENLILQLKTSLNGSNAIVATLYQEIHNISIMVSQLEVYDKNNVLAIRRKISDLQKQLEECRQNNLSPNLPFHTPAHYGTCDHGRIANISKPYIVQRNLNGASYKWGGWGKDSLLGADQNTVWVSTLSTDGRTMSSVYTYPSYEDLLLYTKTVTKYPGSYGQGGGMIMYNSTIYYNCQYSNNLCKYDLKTNRVERKALNDAAYNNHFSYASTPWQEIDLAGDEEGLWVIYASEGKGGNILISKLNATTMEVTQTWSTSIPKPGVTNAFMVCGVLYATRMYRTKMEEIFYMYDTKTGKEENINIPFEKTTDTINSLAYNPNDRKLYMYSDSFLFTYDTTFFPKKR